MDTITVSTVRLREWQRLLRAIGGQVSENMRPGQGKLDTLVTLDNVCAGIDEAIRNASTPNTGGWNENSRFYGIE